MEYLSKTYRLDEEVVRSIEAAKAGGTSPNRFLRLLMGLDANGENAADFEAAHRDAAKAIEQAHPRAVREARESVEQDFRESSPEPADRRPKNCRCRHCGQAFAGPRFTQICSECKSIGHTNSPAECPRCNEGSAI